MKRLFLLTVSVVTLIAVGALIAPESRAQNKCDFTYCALVTCEQLQIAYQAAVTFQPTSAVADYSFCIVQGPSGGLSGGVAWENCTTQRCPVRIGPSACSSFTVMTVIDGAEIAVDTETSDQAHDISAFFHNHRGMFTASEMLLAVKDKVGVMRTYYPKRDAKGKLIDQ